MESALLPYWLLFSLWAIGALQNRERETAEVTPLLVIAGALTALMIGLRYQVGGDWGSYARLAGRAYYLHLDQAIAVGDPGYSFVNWVSAQVGMGVWGVNLFCGSVFMWGVVRFASRQPNPWLTVLVGVPYLIIVVAMGYTRQATAIGILLLGLAAADERAIGRLVLYALAAALFHKTAVLLLPVIVFVAFRRRPIAAALGSLAFFILYYTLLDASSDHLITEYVNREYDSQGAGIRIAMNLLPAGLFLLMRRRFEFSPFLQSYWTVLSVLSVICLVGLFAFSGSAGIDRMALFIIPLQLAILGQVPSALSRERKSSPLLLLAIIAYSAIVQFVWLTFATNAHFWLPYSTTFTAPLGVT